MNKNTYETLLFVLVALVALLCIIGVAVAVKGDPTTFLYNATLQGATIYLVQPDGSLVQPYGSYWSNGPSDTINLDTASIGKWLTTKTNYVSNSYTEHIVIAYFVNASFLRLSSESSSIASSATFNFNPKISGLYVIYIRFTSSDIQLYIYDSNKQLVYSRSQGKIISSANALEWDGNGAVFYFNASSSSLVSQISRAFNFIRGIGVMINFNTGPIDFTYSFMNATPATTSVAYGSKRAYFLMNYSGNPIAYIKLVGPAGTLEKTFRTPGEYYIRASDYNITVFPYVQQSSNSQASNPTTTGPQSVSFTIYAKDGNTGLDVSGTVYLNDTLIGQTGKPLTATLNPNATQTIKVSASGYYDYTFSARLYTGAQYYVFLTPISTTQEKVTVTFYTYDAITGNSISGTVSSGFTTYQAGKPYNITKGYYTFTASAQGYKSLTFSVYISQNTIIPIYLYPQSYTATNSSGSVGYNPSTPTTTISQPNTNTYTGEYVGFHFINPSNTSVTVSVYASIQGVVDTYNVLVETFDMPAHSDAYKSYNLRDVALKAGVLNIITPNPGTYKFTIMANNARIATIAGDIAYQKYVDVYVARGQGFTAMWGSGLQSPFTGTSDWGQLLGALMPLLIIAMILGAITNAMPSKRR